MDTFCDSPFWDENLTWNTTDPYFTHCFEETILAWVPAGFILAFALVDVYFSFHSKRTDRLPWNIYTGLKCFLCLGLISVSIGHVSNLQSYDDLDSVSSSDIFSPTFRITSYVVALCLIILSKLHGIRTSGVQFIFWFSAFVCEAILFRTAVRKFDGDYDISEHKINFVYMIRFVTFPLVTIQFLLQCWADGSMNIRSSKEPLIGYPCPEKNSSFFSKILVTWYDGMAWKGYRQPLTYSDLWDLNEIDQAKTQVPIFHKHWSASQKKAREQTKKTGKVFEASVVTSLFKSYGGTFAFGGVMKLIQDSLAFVSPEILKLLVAHVTLAPGKSTYEESWKGFLYAAILLATSLLQTLFGVQYNRRMLTVGMRVRTALSSAVYRKALKVSNVAKKESTVGEIVNLMSVDTQRFMDLTTFLHMLWTAPIQIAIATYFLYNALGASVFAGLAVMVLLVPANGVIAARVRILQMQQMVLKDNRVKLMSELLSGMKVLKLYAWEPSFQEQIEQIRAKEIVLLRKAAYLSSSTIFMFSVAPFLVSLATFAVYVLSDENNNLNAEKSFVALTLFNIIRMPLTMFPMVIALTVQATVSVKRLNKYMNAEEINPDAVTHDESEKDPIVIQDGNFSWSEETKTLTDINFNVKEGSLVAVVGSVGSGKTSLLNAILGDLIRHSGKVNSKGTIAYVAQGAWIQNATLKDNILFGDHFSDSRYKRVIEACALGPDLEILDAGDQTEIGEKGINLSGGQKQRVALARAAYKESDIYLWDDPLSAVDSHVGKHIFDKLIGPTGTLKGTTRVLVTHGVAYLPKVDKIFVMKEGKISESGTFKELLLKKGEFSEFLLHHLGNADDDEIDVSLIEEMEEVVGQDSLLRKSSSKILKRLASKESIGKSGTTKKQEEKVEPKKQLIEAEKAETGNISLKIYSDYFRTAGLGMAASSLIFNILFQAASAYSNIWLSDWSERATKDELFYGGQQRNTTDLYLGVYGGLGAAQGVTILIGTITLAIGTLNSAQSIHSRMLSRVMKAPMSYFDTTPLGRLVNRFAKDVDTVDNIVPMNIRAFLNIILGVFATVIVISYSTPIFLAFVVPCSVVYFFLQRFYVATSRQLKRIESVSRSPIYSQFGETISGATTIRAFGLQDDFIVEAERKIDHNQQCYYPFIASNLWIAVRLESIGSLIIFASAIFAVLARETISPSIVGLSISYALQVTSLLNFLVRISTELETNIVAVERMKELTYTPQEADWVVSDKRPKKEWPHAGAVMFTNYQARYREGLDLVLRGITCAINPGEKVGIVGRTGAGKSSLTLALFRLVEPAGGTITIDGQNITEIGLHDLRSKITIIPQDPVLFSGNLRINLDPFSAFSDDQVWNCLELAHLKPFISSLPEGLMHEVAEEGQNFSVGQRQLICLARALLRKTKILVLDEATAAVDLETDDLIQKTIRSEFDTSTVITIAHRLNTIMDSNRVVVLDKGEIREFDTPQNLLGKTNSIFYGMAKDAGLV